MHTDPELLALLALGEPIDADERSHVERCRACAAELAELRRVAELVRGAESVAIVEPDPHVWARVRQELGGRRDAGLDTGSTGAEARAYAHLTPVLEPWSQASGEAELSTDEQGRRLLQVALDADLPSSGVRQAWLVHRDDPDRRQTLGILDGQHGLWTVEHAIDLAEYAFLEISQQTVGSSEHSGQTIVRGELLLVA